MSQANEEPIEGNELNVNQEEDTNREKLMNEEDFRQYFKPDNDDDQPFDNIKEKIIKAVSDTTNGSDLNRKLRKNQSPWRKNHF
jgi:hypothetical protein